VGTALDHLIELLDLEDLEVNIFRGRSPEDDRQRVFGGQVAGQALVAAGRTVEAQYPVHSLHAYFLRPGDPTRPILYEVDRIRDGRSFITRRVVAIQHGKAIFNLQASFHKMEEGYNHQDRIPEAPDPESLPTWQARMEPYRSKLGPWADREQPIDQRPIDPPFWEDPSPREPEKLVWMRADGCLPDDPLLHACVVAYASDMSLLDTTFRPHGRDWGEAGQSMASLDHAMWFHRPFRADEWFLYYQTTPSASGARGFALGHIFTRAGALVVSVAQEGLIRPVR
jgi:acyl-CoA thioesterase-2